MVIVAGHITVDPEQRESYLAGSVSSADLLDPGRVNLCAPRNEQGAAMRSASVAEYDIADARPLSRKGRA
jgi:hypothetical protein